MTSSLFWDVTQHRLVVSYVSAQPIGPIFKGLGLLYLCKWDDSASGNVGNYLPTLSNIPEERKAHIEVLQFFCGATAQMGPRPPLFFFFFFLRFLGDLQLDIHIR
jgi:hypothetical protein